MNKLIRGPICFEYSAILAMLGVTCQSRDKNDSSCRQARQAILIMNKCFNCYNSYGKVISTQSSWLHPSIEWLISLCELRKVGAYKDLEEI